MTTIELNEPKEILKCAICEKEVKRENSKLIKTCEHLDSIIISEMSGVMRGIGSVKQ